jgi:hypothetical protein
MAESPLPNEVISEQKVSKSPRWLLFVIPLVLLSVCCVVLTVVVRPFFNLNVESGGYSIESVTLSTDLEDNEPVGIKDVFMPSEPIICTVKTSGVDGIIGMRWFVGENEIFEHIGKTQNNTISTYIESNKSAILPEGKYRVEIFLVENSIEEVVEFEVKVYHPSVIPPISIPEGHQNIEIPWYPEVPFAFDEVWVIDDIEWKVNEVKVVLMDGTQEYFVDVVIDTDMKDIASIGEEEAKARTLPVALYAIENGYVEKAKSLEIDGKYHDLDQFFFVTLINPPSSDAYRVKFLMDELQ